MPTYDCFVQILASRRNVRNFGIRIAQRNPRIAQIPDSRGTYILVVTTAKVRVYSVRTFKM